MLRRRTNVDASLPRDLTAPATVLVDVGKMVRAGCELISSPTATPISS